MTSQGRADRIAQRIKEELSSMFLMEVSDPRLSAVYISHVKVDRELAFATIFVSTLEGVERQEEVLDGLRHASGFLRSQLAQRIDLRSFPQLRFQYDLTLEQADRIDRLIASLHTDDAPPEDEDD